ncbi:hypothetical protein RclHR1_10190002 [Rhizophagus clarus]|uniref:Protein kinase domain-containing protein n=1 Tax=Rhizophagus clarus TaxID=94130 RepID=A0A2Z6Q0W9_9GLOM|nr:hypothetical protein RclHR1_10190002 [Rhizophagus clarus]
MSSLEPVDWLEKSISDDYLNYYEYSDFNNLVYIGRGSYGTVVRANWKNTDNIFALKTFNHDNITLKEVVNEVLYSDVIRKYSLVLEYADSGTLKAYLNKRFNEFNWDDKYQLAFQLASAVTCMHECGIIHRDLHADNILVHQKRLKLADFGLSKKIARASSSTSKVFGVVPFVDPKSLNDESYKLNKKSDVYSVGVLMWQISSGYQPFPNNSYDVSLILSIVKGKREGIIDDTPIEYSSLYTECWKHEPNERPDMQDVVSRLKTMIFPKQRHIINDDIIEIEETDSVKVCEPIPELDKKRTVELNNELMSNDKLSINHFYNNNIKTKSQPNPPNFLSIHTNVSSKFSIGVNELITAIIEKHDEGYTFEQIQELISQRISQLNQITDYLVNWLTENQDEPKYIWLFGLLYYYNIAQVYLAKCYDNERGTEQNKNLAFGWYQKSAENNSIIGQYYLGYCYEFNIGIENNENKFIDWYQKATNNGNMIAKFYLANCYRLGKGINKDENKAFEYYKTLANNEIADAQHQLGNCFYYGVGTQVNDEQAVYWYEKAANNGDIISKHVLEQNYNKKISAKKNKSIEIRIYYRMIFFEGLRRIGINNYYGIGTKQNYKKAFSYFQKAAEGGNKFAQYNLGNCYKKGKGTKTNKRKAFEFYQKSAEQGYKDAHFQLGECYDKGIGVEINKVKAFELYNIVAKKEHDIAQCNLGILYEKGEGIEKDLEKAVYWYNKAAENGDKVAQYNLGQYYRLGIEVDKDKAKAFEYYKKSADQGYLNAQLELGHCYYSGIGINADKIKAFELYEMAAKKGNNNAQRNIAFLYEQGEGTKKNKEKAIHWYKIAIENGNHEAKARLNDLL